MSPTASKSPSPPHDATPEPNTAAAADASTSAEPKASVSTPASPSAQPSTSAKHADDDSAEPEVDSSADAVKDGADAESSSTPTATASADTWQAIWSPQYNAYYFFNSLTQQTTWENPLQPTTNDPAAEASTSTSASADPSTSASPAPDATSTSPSAADATPASLAQMYALQEAAAAQGIDPSLAYLDPSLAGPSGASGAGYYHTAKFNARTGAFARPDARDPGHLSEFERAKRMSEVYFDVGAWEKEVEARKQEEAAEEEAGKKRKRPSKKDVERFKEQKKQKKIAKTAWLRN
ncbi:uncharacterized protein STEHIDRAFT_146639 [Stereum hirsutum FP-91666 SS1]|uniref:uncharacterized protein n=1 Tax=Stereum hirsutum (strain FP-91666) TaxID=721885 RepID=UPI000440EADD|nr:uncharacterized protein STEHIDRAFT_146639 [Stereum hirsutum FP-91666 SS1]EIM87120.1 hypothetical protein STEHIDRAFT_146639 [Stereum hirsutum FP-91666 SS1]